MISKQDRYILGSMIFLYLVCIWHGVVTLIEGAAAGAEADRDAFIVFASSFACLQVMFIISVVISVSRVLYLKWKVKFIFKYGIPYLCSFHGLMHGDKLKQLR